MGAANNSRNAREARFLVHQNLQGDVEEIPRCESVRDSQELGHVQGTGSDTCFLFSGETRYETNRGLHVNMVDRRGKIVDVEDEDVHGILEELIEKVREKTGRDAKSLLVIIE